MNSFPTLKSGAIQQYPAEKNSEFSTQVVRFIDGSEQRFRDYALPIRRWVVRLDLVDETELNGLREFFRIQVGASGQFTFTDPWDQTPYVSCSLETDQMVDDLFDEGRSKTSLTIRENRS